MQVLVSGRMELDEMDRFITCSFFFVPLPRSLTHSCMASNDAGSDSSLSSTPLVPSNGALLLPLPIISSSSLSPSDMGVGMGIPSWSSYRHNYSNTNSNIVNGTSYVINSNTNNTNITNNGNNNNGNGNSNSTNGTTGAYIGVTTSSTELASNSVATFHSPAIPSIASVLSANMGSPAG
jgi:hypothetical protein